MASYNPPSEDLPIFDNSVFVATNTTTLTRLEANKLYLRKTIADTCTALETFSAGLEASFINVSGTLTAATLQAFSNILSPLITSNTYQVSDASLDCNFCNNQDSGVLNIANNARTGNINIGTQQTNNQLSLGSLTNTQTNISGGAIALFGDTSIDGDTDITGNLTITGTTTTNNITTNLTNDIMYFCNEAGKLGRIYIGGNKSSSSGGVYIGGTNNPISIYGSCAFVYGLILENGTYITAPTVPPTLPSNAINYYYNFPTVSSSVTVVSTKYNPVTNTAGAVNYLNAGIYVVNIDSVSRFTGTTTSGNYNYSIGIASGTTTGTVTTGTVTNISPSSNTVRNFFFNNILNVDFNNSFTLCFTLTTNSFVNLFANYSTFTIAPVGATVTVTLSGCIRRIG
jgi:hypothetical protein